MRIVVHGGHPLNGTFRPSGNSNSAIALIAAALLTDETVSLHDVPDTLSTATMLDAAAALGVTIERAGATCHLRAGAIQTRSLAEDMTDGQVSAILFLAPLLARRGHARIELPPPLSRYYPHLTALRDLGISVQSSGTVLDLQAEPWDYREIVLVQASVTTTALTCMLAAALGQDTLIYNAASEPHVQDLQRLLVAMGAEIDGIGSNRLRVRGGMSLHGASIQLSPDHIEVASVAAIAAITHGSLRIEGVIPDHLRPITRVLSRLGVNLYLDDSTLVLPPHDALVASQHEEELDVPIETAPWPGFPSDLVAMTTVVATQARGMTLIHEKLFNNRLLFVDKLTAMGAQIVLCDPHRALVIGPAKLRGDYMDTPDVRTGLALLGAALCAQGKVTIDSAELIGRTFEGVVDKLVGLGAQIEVVTP